MGINGIDKDTGMENVNFNEELYEEILKIYLEDGEPMLKLLRQNIQNTDLKLFSTDTHAMKSASHGIGALTMSELFKEMEFAGKAADMELISQKLPACLDMFEKLLKDIREYFDGTPAEENNDTVSGKNDFLSDMANALECMDTDRFEEKLEKLTKECPADKAQVLNKIKEKYEEFDFAEVIHIIKTEMGE